MRGPAAVLTVLIGCLTAPTGARADTQGMGLVVAMRGQVSAQTDGEPERRLGCGDVIHSGDRVATGRASRVAVLAGDVYAQLFVSSAARFSTAGDGSAALALERGRMRVIDPRRGSPMPVRVSVGPAETSFAGNDVDVYALGPASARNAVICSERSDLAVQRSDGNGGPTVASRGQCAVASLGKATYRAHVPSTRIGLAEANECELALVSDVALRLAPSDVAAAQRPRSPLPKGIRDPRRDACDDPGSGCLGALSGPADEVSPFPSDPLPSN